MIVFDLACAAGHVFEAWFGSSADYEAQRGRGLVACPVCGEGQVGKAVMAPAVAAKGNSREVVAAPRGGAAGKPVPMRSGPPSPNQPSPDQLKAMMAAMARMQAKALEGSEHVGPRFASEARAIHDGEADERPIHGQATIEEARGLIEDGIPVAPLPFPMRPPEQLQ